MLLFLLLLLAINQKYYYVKLSNIQKTRQSHYRALSDTRVCFKVLIFYYLNFRHGPDKYSRSVHGMSVYVECQTLHTHGDRSVNAS